MDGHTDNGQSDPYDVHRNKPILISHSSDNGFLDFLHENQKLSEFETNFV